MSAPVAARPAPIDLAVVGGYLGAGKTTVVNAILQAPHGRRIAVLVNDFGAVNIDARLVRARGDDLIELDNGCICCTIGGALVDALTRVAMRGARPDLLLVEASGVADPAKIAQIGLLNGAFRLTAVLVVADALALQDTLADPLVGAIAQRQLDGASAVVVTKLDLLAPAQRDAALADVRAHAPTDIVVAATHGEIPLALLFDAAVPDRRTTLRVARGHRPIGSDAMPALASTTIAVPDVLDKARLRAWLKALPRTILRAKGIVRIADADGVALRVCQLAARRIRFASIEDEGLTGQPGVMVFIGIIDASIDATLRDGLTQCRTMAGSLETPSNAD
ncbi:CobW family GTP-binding protein [Burkholderia pseudomultivorans]|uniref:Metal chaperone YciC n=1 Tax=Burkholderia pseudomultivorans TaxID=1207504 RepID=A0ABU2E449_9BURK|nr:GTP-binding protein [Burkholderia pseudomultivorans]MDR8729699.1 putative metal chaperone YciC [Burkholderia pseudomultivorans]MDR8736964.1 putative metal chaperone YciC [Burkholderia pseudomultivorans]MDR8743141.1 putative metal chaperone YciC [Burkholderia pseudomultivorans]MDR8754516.1 putative metal chaperone YciC [Burkholderia pseudomultivorans]MDR8779869.1 putative metal chaperone YciC [Burkholderia pseudomultivorans]